MKKILLPILVLLASCAGKETHISNVIDPLAQPEGEIKNLSEVAESVQYIPLQSTDSAVIGRVWNVRYNGSRYYLQSGAIIFVFDNGGKLINKLDRKGRGPGEYQFISDFDVSRDNKFLALTSNRELVLYGIENEGYLFIRKIPLNPQPSRINFVGDENNLLLQYANTEGTNPYSRILFNLNGDTVAKRHNYLMFTTKDSYMVYSIWENLSYWYDDHLITKELQNDTLFRFENERFLAPYIIMNSKGRGLTPEARSNGLYYSNHGTEYLQIQKLFESGQYLFFASSYSVGSGRFLYDKKSGKIYSVDKKAFLTDDLLGGPAFDPIYCYNGLFISWTDAFKFKEHFQKQVQGSTAVKNKTEAEELKKLADRLNENDNPVLTIVRMR